MMQYKQSQKLQMSQMPFLAEQMDLRQRTNKAQIDSKKSEERIIELEDFIAKQETEIDQLKRKLKEYDI